MFSPSAYDQKVGFMQDHTMDSRRNGTIAP